MVLFPYNIYGEYIYEWGIEKRSCRIRLCGAPAITVDEKAVKGLRHKAIALIAFLAVEARPVSRDTLATIFWPYSGQSSARQSLRTCLFQVKHALPSGAIITNGEILELDSKEISVDVWEIRDIFLSLADSESLELLAGAEELCQGEFMEGFTLPDCIEFDSWQLTAGETIRQQMMYILEEIVQMKLETDSPEAALDPVMRLISLDSLEESSHRLAIEVYAQCGRWATAYKQYENCLTILKKELGAEPEAETVKLAEEVKRRSARFSTTKRNPLFSPRECRQPSIPVNHFFGRESELAQIGDLLDSGCRSITITGPAGMGKTRLALETTIRFGKEFANGVFFVDLTQVKEASQVPRLIAESLDLRLNFTEPSELLRSLSEQLTGRRVLLILDNFEHVISASGDISNLIQSTKMVKVIITSREILRIAAERVIRLPPLRFHNIPQSKRLPPLRR